MRKSKELESHMNRLCHELLLENYEELFLCLHSVLSFNAGILEFNEKETKATLIEMMYYIHTHHRTERMFRFRKNVKVKMNIKDANEWWENQKKDLGLN